MFEGLCTSLSKEMVGRYGNQLNCLPYSRALLDFFKARGIEAIPLVARAVVLGKVSDDPAIWHKVNGPKLCEMAITAEGGNGFQQVGIRLPATDDKPEEVIEFMIPFRTLGYPHGAERETGTYDENGAWNGHLVVVAENALIDMTIGQLNSPKLSVHFDPTWTIVEADPGFLAGANPIIGIQAGMMIRYQAFPDERTYEASQSWGSRGGQKFRQELRAVGSHMARLWLGKKLD